MLYSQEWSGLKKLLMMNASNGGLPGNYRRVEYIGGDGDQYIDSGIECTSDLSVDFEFSVPSMVNASICGGINTSSPIFRHHGTPYIFSDDNVLMYYYMKNEVKVIPADIAPPSINKKYRIYINATDGYYQFSGDDYNETGTFTPLEYSTTGKNYGIMARISNTGALQSRPCKIYSFKFFKGAEKIGDFVPCYRKSDGEIGMYDSVSKMFFTNSGTGTFIKGQNI